jgi:hypothetical protein
MAIARFYNKFPYFYFLIVTMGHLRLAIIFFIIVIVASCKKSSLDKDYIGTGVANDSTLLSKFILLNKSVSSPHDTLLIAYYKYDDKKRITQGTVLYYNYYTKPDTTAFQATIYDIAKLYYANDTDTLPFKVINTRVGGNGGFFQTTIDTVYRYYDAIGRIAKDSIHLSSNLGNFLKAVTVSKNDFSYNGSYTYKKFYDYTAGVFGGIDTIFKTTSGSNFIYQKKYSIDIKDYTFTFDNHPNPLYRNGFGVYPIIGADITAIDEAEIGVKTDIQKNNYLYANETYQNGWPNTGISYKYINFLYTYRADGYPLKVISSIVRGSDYGTGPNNLPTTVYTGIYIYN